MPLPITPDFASIPGRIFRAQVTIPANTDLTTTVRSLLAAADFRLPIVSFKIMGLNADSTSRGALNLASSRVANLAQDGGQPAALIGTDYTASGEFVAAGSDYTSQALLDVDSFIRSASASTVPAVIVARY